MIPEANIVALREALERDGIVTFKNGSVVEYERCPRCKGHGCLLDPAYPGQRREFVTGTKTCPRCRGWKARLVVVRRAGGKARYRFDTEIRRAYEMALSGPRPKQQPSGDGSKFGDDPPW